MERDIPNYGRGRSGRDGRGRGRNGPGDVGGRGNRGRGRYPHQQQQQQDQGRGRRGGDFGRGRDGGRGGGRRGRGRNQQAGRVGEPPMQEQIVGQQQQRTPVSYQERGRGRGGGDSSSGKAEASSSSAPPPPSKTPSKPLPQYSTKEVSGSELPLKRPDKGGEDSIGVIKLLVNHFAVNFNPENTITHYDVDVKHEKSANTPESANRPIPRSELRRVREQLCNDKSDSFGLEMTAYDGNKNIFSAAAFPVRQAHVELSDGSMTDRYTIAIKFVNELHLVDLINYMEARLPRVPREVLQGMDVVMKENPSRKRISIGRCFYPSKPRPQDDLHNGVAAFRGFHQSLKPTSQGLALCLDYSVLSCYKPMPVLEFLIEHVDGFEGVNDFDRLRAEVSQALKGLKVTVTHRSTQQIYTIVGLSEQNTRDISFSRKGREPDGVTIVNYFKDKHNKDITHLDIPCLNLGKNMTNYVPMEFCMVAKGQRYPKERLQGENARHVRSLSLALPQDRKTAIEDMIGSEDGPCGAAAQNFEIQVSTDMTSVNGRVIGPPQLQLGAPTAVTLDPGNKCQWNLRGKSVAHGEPIERWALIDFSGKLWVHPFINILRDRCSNLHIPMKEPLVCRSDNMMDELSSVRGTREILEGVAKEANQKRSGKLQIIVCVMATKHIGYKYLKYVSEFEIGVVTQCCLFSSASKRSDQYLANLCLKINAKIGGTNVELVGGFPPFGSDDYVMFVGADVNHPSSRDETSPSIVAVVATVNWPAANRYAARVSRQPGRREKIEDFGRILWDLVRTFENNNDGNRPKRIVIFRDGVSEGQFDMVLNQELMDFQKVSREADYRPTISLIVAQKRHQTRLFTKSGGNTGTYVNVPPGTVVDTTVVHPFEFDFYLCSHFGGLGTSKPTHYHVLWDEHEFTSDQLQKLIYNLCFTYARCTKPVSLVPPVYYADLAAYRGRLYMEVLMELDPDQVVINNSLHLHQELKDIMFFV